MRCATARSPSTTGAIDYLGGDVPAALDQVLASPDLPARRLATFLGNWSRFGAVEVAADLSTPFAEWEALERRAVDDRMAIYLRPISPHRPNLCAALDPGDDFRQPRDNLIASAGSRLIP